MFCKQGIAGLIGWTKSKQDREARSAVVLVAIFIVFLLEESFCLVSDVFNSIFLVSLKKGCIEDQ